MKNTKFEPNPELDARILLAAMRGGMDGIISYAFSRRDHFPEPDLAVKRAYWFKEQSEEYITEVTNLTAKLESNDNS